MSLDLVKVFINPSMFLKGVCYEYTEKAEKNSDTGEYTTKERDLIYAGKWVRNEIHGHGQGSSAAEVFIDEHGKENKIWYTSEENVAFRKKPSGCSISGGTRNKKRKNRKSIRRKSIRRKSIRSR